MIGEGKRKKISMTLGRRILIGCLGVMVVLTIGAAFKYSLEPRAKNMPSSFQPRAQSMPRERSIARPTIQVRPMDHPAVDWNHEFRNSTDYFPLLARAAKAGLEGDGRAAYYVSRKWLECASLAREFGSSENPEDKFNEAMRQSAYAPPELIDKQRMQFKAYSGFYKVGDPDGNDVFANLPSREGGYRSVNFWMNLAYQNNDPVAQTVHAALATGSMPPNSDQIDVAQTDLNHAIASGDPEAIFRAGMVITNGLYVDRIEGFALSLAACDLGYDCTAANSSGTDLPFGECVAMGTCAAGSVFSDWVTKNIGADAYALAYARTQQIEDALARGDSGGLRQYAMLKH